MKLKNGVDISGVQPPIWYAIGVAATVYLNRGHLVTVTSLTDGKHMEDSLHYKGLAVDLRIRGIFPNEVVQIVKDLDRLLNPLGFDVVDETDHIHIEYDPKEKETWKEWTA